MAAAFAVSLGFGFCSGVAFIAGLSYFQKKRAKQRMNRAVAIAALNLLDQDDIKKLMKTDLIPQWVQFPEMERVHWLNKELREIWPYVNKAASAIIKEQVEPILKQYKPPVFLSIKFNKLTLGTIAPQIAGVKVVETDEEEIILEVDVKWGGNPSIILGMTTIVGLPLQVQVKDVQFFGLFRLRFRPLVGQFPCFGALTIALRNKPSMDFRLKIIGGELPGIHGIVDNLLRTAVVDSLLWPSRIVVPILPGDYKDLELRPTGTLDVKLVEARNLKNTDFIGKSDPFAILFVRPIPSKMEKSKVIANNLNPIWNESFKLVVEDPATQRLMIKVLDKEALEKAEPLGELSLKLSDLQPGQLLDVWLPLVEDMDNPKAGNAQGEVHLEVLYRPHPPDGDSPSAPDIAGDLNMRDGLDDARPLDGGRALSHMPSIVRGVLTVTVRRAEALRAADMGGTSDPFVRVFMRNGDMKKKTKVIPKTLNPVWDQTFEFLVEDAARDMLQLEVWDHDTFGKDFLGRVSITLTRVLKEGEYEDVFKLSEVDTGKLHLTLKWKQVGPTGKV